MTHIAVLQVILAAFTGMSEADADPRERIREVDSWVYQLQKVDVDALAQTDADMVVMDHADDDLLPWDPLTIVRLREAGGKRRIILAYVSVGEAESYRPYWRQEWRANRPDWIGRMNAAWSENYPVKYWSPHWQEIILGYGGYLDRIMAQGFDGIYLDRLDVYEHWGPTGKGKDHAKNSAIAMVRFLQDIADHVRINHSRPDFLIVGQNAPALAAVPGYLKIVDAIALEDVFYYGPSSRRRTKRYTRHILEDLLRPAVSRGLPIFDVEYLKRHQDRRRFVHLARRQGLIPYASPDRRLDRLR